MSGETIEESVVETPSNEPAEDSAKTLETIEAMQASIDKVISINKELIASRDAAKVKTREAESQLTEQRKGVEGELDAMEQKFNEKFNGVLIDAALEKALNEAGARNVVTAKRLLDRQDITVVNGTVDADAIQTLIDGLKETESYMFTDPTTETVVKPKATKPARAGEPANEDVVNKEIKAASTQAELQAVIDKHNIKQ